MFKNESKKNLSIIIVGIGKVGRTLVAQLFKEGHDITVIDKNASVIDTITNMYDVMGIVGNGASYTVQQEAGVDMADLFIAITDSDELNLLCCTLAGQNEGCATIARVRTPDYTKEIDRLKSKLGLEMVINPELESAREIANFLSLPSALEVNSFANDQAEMIEYVIPRGSILDGLSVAEMGKKVKTSSLICCVKRGDEVYIPSGRSILHEGDIISVVGGRRFAHSFMEDIGEKNRDIKDCLIVGGGRAAYYLADALLKNKTQVKIIESNKARCEVLSSLLPKAVIINGDGTDENLLREEGIEYAESFVPLVGIDEENVILTLFANQVSDAKVVTMINRTNFKKTISKLNMGSTVYPQLITSEAIIAYVRAKSASKERTIETLYHLHDERVEALEFNVNEASDVTGKTLKDLQIKPGVLIAFINRHGKTIIPSGNDTIEVGDRVMVVTTNVGFNNITDVLV